MSILIQDLRKLCVNSTSTVIHEKNLRRKGLVFYYFRNYLFH